MKSNKTPVHISQVNNNYKNASNRNDPTKTKEWNFQDYLKKFEPSTIWEQIDKQRKYHGRSISIEKQTEMMCRGIDPTDEILKLQVQNGDASIILEKDARRSTKLEWKPPTNLNRAYKDKFYLRRRLYELMKQAIYQTRNKMIIMQKFRDKYNQSALYRMGFLFNKADNAAKTFGKFSFRAFRACLMSREKVLIRMPIFDLLTANERQLQLWFDVEILVDLIKTNDDICRQVFVNHTTKRKKAFDKAFVP